MQQPSFTFRAKIAGFLVIALGAIANRAVAQSPADPPTVTSASPYRNAVRVDVGGILVLNLAYSAFNKETTLLLPLLASYERQVSGRFSLAVEGLLNGGEPAERKSGLSVQSRIYFLTDRAKTGLVGLYLAPVIGYRAVTFDHYYPPVRPYHFVGAGILIGGQVPLSPRSGLFLDASLGFMSWGKLGTATVLYLNPSTYYEKDPVTADGRLGIGIRF